MLKKADVYILIAAAAWAFTGVFYKGVENAGVSSLEAVGLRLIVASLAALIYYVAKEKSLPPISWQDVPLYFGTGVCSLVFFNIMYFRAISLTSVSIAVALLYTSPCFVVLLSRLMFKEPLTKAKVLATGFTLIGCFLVTGAFQAELAALPAKGIIFGVAAGFAYALYSVLGKYPLARRSSDTVSFYTLFFAAVAMFPFARPDRAIFLLTSPTAIASALALGVASCTLPYVAYTKGLSQMESGRASLLVAVELVIAAFLGVVTQGDRLGFSQIIGIAMIFSAVTLLNLNKAPAAAEAKQ
ncbi:MAG: DMT family transporter [Clostridiales bacterium]